MPWNGGPKCLSTGLLAFPSPQFCARPKACSQATVVPVKVKAKGKEAVVETYAFLDPGSNTSFCTDQLTERLGATRMKTTFVTDNYESQGCQISKFSGVLGN